MSANEVENPLAYLRKLLSLEEKLDSIQSSITKREEEAQIIEQLNKIQEQLNIIAKNKNVRGVGNGGQSPTTEPVNPPKKPKGLRNILKNIFSIKKSK